MKNIRTGKSDYFLLLLAILAISTASIFIRFAQHSLSSLVIAAYRLALASLFMLPFSLRQTIQTLRRRSTRDFLLLALAGLLLAAHFATWIISLNHTSVIISVVLVTTTPIWVALISPLITKDRISKGFWLGLSVAIVGMVVVSGVWRTGSAPIRSGAFPGILIGSSLALIGAFCAAGYVLIGRILRDTTNNREYTFSVYTIASFILLFAVILLPGESLKIAVFDLKWLLLLALVPQLIGHSLINWFLGFRPAHEVSLFLLGEPIGSTILAVIFLQEFPTAQEVVGAGIILAGITVAVRRGNQEKKISG